MLGAIARPGSRDSADAAQVGGWFVDITKAVAGAAKTVKPEERDAIDRITTLFTPTSADPN